MARLVSPRRGEPILDRNGNMTTRFAEYIEANEDETNENEGNNNRLSSIEGLVSLQSAVIKTLTDRVDDLERSNYSDTLNTKVARLGARLDALIDELIAAVKANAPDKEQESLKVVILENVLKENRLLNDKIEEAFETDLTLEDIE